jgi:hypothetical protein
VSKKPSLSDALHEASGKRSPGSPVAGGGAPAPTYGGDLPPSRRGKKIVSGYFDPAVSRQLKQLALDHDKTVQSLLAEALNDLFEKYGGRRL